MTDDAKARVRNFNETVRRYHEDRRMREGRIYILLGRLQELAAEGRGMDPGEVRFPGRDAAGKRGRLSDVPPRPPFP